MAELEQVCKVYLAVLAEIDAVLDMTYLRLLM
jgi:hypothetical protein